jgi:hypothetical protein
MTTLVWDAVGSRLYENGVDRGVLYLEDGSGVPWNGLTSVEERFTGAQVTPYYWDGVKYAEFYTVPDFSASVKAYTYPDEFLEFEGIQEVDNGLFAGGQTPKTFGLTYRTLIGNDLNSDLGYKIHILCNLTAVPSNIAYKVNVPSPNAIEFEWVVTAIPSRIPGYRPTAHLIFDTTKSSDGFVADLEAILYGDDITEAHIPPFETLVSLADSWTP